MKADPRFVKQPKHFWANIRIISQQVGYTERGKRAASGEQTKASGPIKVPTLPTIVAALEEIDLTAAHLADAGGQPTELGQQILDYFRHRADILRCASRGSPGCLYATVVKMAACHGRADGSGTWRFGAAA